MWNSPLRRLRVIGKIEGLSFLLLLFIAVPLKHLAGYPMAVKIAGWIHGILFILFCLALAETALERRWTLRKTLLPAIAALLPFGPFLIDERLRAEEDATPSPS